jgi:L-methionine (R)-S-oxide reductase
MSAESELLPIDWSSLGRSEAYAELAEQVVALIGAERDAIANLANVAALLYRQMPELNWCGFYLLRRGELVLGPFQGKPACVRIAMGRGVCGTAAQARRTIVVADVHAFPGHIACDADSRSEIVAPMVSGERLVGVMDLDSPRVGRFDEDDRAGLERIAEIIVGRSDWAT